MLQSGGVYDKTKTKSYAINVKLKTSF